MVECDLAPTEGAEPVYIVTVHDCVGATYGFVKGVFKMCSDSYVMLGILRR